MYLLADKQEGGNLSSVVKRMRSIPRHHQAELQMRHFGVDPRTNAAVVRSVQMAPSLGIQVLMTVQGRMLSNALNLKRKMTVSE